MDVIVLKDIKYARAYIKCDCGHFAKDHYLGEGWCHHSKHAKAGQCGCTWYHPNIHWINKQKAIERSGE